VHLCKDAEQVVDWITKVLSEQVTGAIRLERPQPWR